MKPLKVLVTRPRAQAERFADCLTAAGFIPIVSPMIEIVALEASAQKTALSRLKALSQADGAIVISSNAFSFAQELAKQTTLDLSVGIRWYAVGRATAEVMERAGVSPMTPHDRFDSEGLLSLQELKNVAGKHLVILAGQGGRRKLELGLHDRGAEVSRIELYSRLPLSSSEIRVDDEPDVLTAMSGETIESLKNHIQAETKKDWFRKPLFVPSARTADLAFDSGFGVVRVTKTAAEKSLLEALCQYATEV